MAGEAAVLSALTTAVPYAGAAVGMLTGLANLISGKKAAKNNIRPVLKQSGMYEDMLSMYEDQAQYGYDASTMNFLTEENQNALTGTLQTMLMAGASPNDVAGAYAGYSNQMQKAAADSSDKRWAKIAALSSAADKLFESKQQEFLYNEDGPYKDAAQAAAAKQNVGQQQLWGGLQSVVGTAVKQRTEDMLYNIEMGKTGSKSQPSGVAPVETTKGLGGQQPVTLSKAFTDALSGITRKDAVQGVSPAAPADTSYPGVKELLDMLQKLGKN